MCPILALMYQNTIFVYPYLAVYDTKAFLPVSDVQPAAKHAKMCNNDEFESDNDGYELLKKLAPTVVDGESEMSESDDESNSESENDDVDKENGSKPYNPYIEYYVNQALAN